MYLWPYYIHTISNIFIKHSTKNCLNISNLLSGINSFINIFLLIMKTIFIFELQYLKIVF